MVGKQMVQMHLVGCRSKYMDKKEQSWQNVVIQQVVQVDVQEEVLAVVVPVQVAQLARAVALEQVVVHPVVLHVVALVVHLLLVAVLIALVVMAILVMIVVAAVAIVS